MACQSELSVSDDVRRNYVVGSSVYWGGEVRNVSIILNYTDGSKETISVGSKKYDYYGFYYEVKGIETNDEMNDSLLEGSGKISFYNNAGTSIGSYRIYVKPLKELADKVINGEAYVLDINLSVKNVITGAAIESDIQPAAPIRIRIPMPTDWADKTFDLYHYTSEGTPEKIDYIITDSNMIEFVVTALSYYTLEDKCKHTSLELLETVKPATCIEAGWRWAECEDCGKQIKQIIPVNLNAHKLRNLPMS